MKNNYLVDKFSNLIDQHEEYRLESCLNLRADENYTSSKVRRALGSDLANRNTSPDPKFVYRGTKYLNDAAELTIDLGKKLFKAGYLNIWAPTGHTANIIIFFAFCHPGDKILVLSPEHGGYGGMAKENLPQRLGLTTHYFPFNYETMNIDTQTGAMTDLIERERPSLIVLGATYFLFPHPVRDVTRAAHRIGIPVAYDGSHVMGLIAGGQFQDPLSEGADVLFGSTMKTLGGPPGGILLTNNRDTYEKLHGVISYNAVTNKQQNRIVALGMRFAELLDGGKEYASQVIRNAKYLAATLESRGVGIMFKEMEYTASHIILLDVGGFRKNVKGYVAKFAAKLEESNIIIDDRGRIGVAEVTRIGMREEDMENIADLMSKVLVKGTPPEKVKAEIRQLRKRFRKDPLYNEKF